MLVTLRREKPALVVVDSIQTLDLPDQDGVPGSVGQIRESAAALTTYAKASGTPLFMVGHITKEGSLAGPKVLEHMVNVVLQFEGDRHHAYRMLRAAKNRFGTTAELGIYEMTGEGLASVDHLAKSSWASVAVRRVVPPSPCRFRACAPCSWKRRRS